MAIDRRGRTVIVLAVALCAGTAAADSTSSLRLQLPIGDFVLGVADRVRATSPEPIPDLSMLTTEPVERSESSGFGWREHPIQKRRKFHHGTDFRARPGTPVLAAGNGIVTFA